MRTITQIGLLIWCGVVFIPVDGFAKDTHKEELRAFNEAQVGRSMSTGDFWDGIVAIEQFLQDYPNTFMRGDALGKQLMYYSMVMDDPVVLENLAVEYLKEKNHSDNAYATAASTFIDAGAVSDKALVYALKAFELGQEKYAKWGNEEHLANRIRLVAKAYQLVGKLDKATEEMQNYIAHLNKYPNPRRTSTDKQAAIDRAQIEMLEMYITHQKWDAAYPLAVVLMQTAVVRDIDFVRPSARPKTIEYLWSQAYTGKHGSSKGMARVYASLKAERDKAVGEQMAKARISRSAPMLAAEKLGGGRINLAELKGKAVVVTFWAGWCSPCIAELPYLQSLQDKFRKQGQDVEFLAVNVDDDNPMRRNMVASFKYQKAPGLTFALGDLGMREAFGSKDIPYTCIIDPEGQIRYERKGMGADFEVAMEQQLKWVTGMDKVH